MSCWHKIKVKKFNASILERIFHLVLFFYLAITVVFSCSTKEGSGKNRKPFWQAGVQGVPFPYGGLPGPPRPLQEPASRLQGDVQEPEPGAGRFAQAGDNYCGQLLSLRRSTCSFTPISHRKTEVLF